MSKGSQKITLYGFADASKFELCAAAFLTHVDGNGGMRQNLLVAKSRVAPRNLSIPRLQFVAAHMLAKLVKHVQLVLQYYNFEEQNLWSDSVTIPYWMAN